MAIPFNPDDQPDHRNAPPSADVRELILYRDMNHAAATNLVGMLDGVRSKDPTWSGASVRMRMAHARNMAEAYLAALNTVEAECLYHLAERETVIDLTRMPPARKTFGRRVSDATLPAVVSPAVA
jgi:hypothetical protein